MNEFFLRNERECHKLFRKEYLFREKHCGTVGKSQNLNYSHFLGGRLGEKKEEEDINAGL